jgi:hypothetical protein
MHSSHTLLSYTPLIHSLIHTPLLHCLSYIASLSAPPLLYASQATFVGNELFFSTGVGSSSNDKTEEEGPVSDVEATSYQSAVDDAVVVSSEFNYGVVMSYVLSVWEECMRGVFGRSE